MSEQYIYDAQVEAAVLRERLRCASLALTAGIGIVDNGKLRQEWVGKILNETPEPKPEVAFGSGLSGYLAKELTDEIEKRGYSVVSNLKTEELLKELRRRGYKV